MIKRKDKLPAIHYANENTIQTIKVIEALEGARFEPVSINTICQRVGTITEIDKALTWDKARRILLTLKLLGWVQENEKGEWLLGARILRFSNRYSEVLIANSIK
ncbi:MAG: hypothetical protein JSS81_05980 [Acidobacteria bacterium]|nr:hypothetical protein [Acidobacteriota bacterium]